MKVRFRLIIDRITNGEEFPGRQGATERKYFVYFKEAQHSTTGKEPTPGILTIFKHGLGGINLKQSSEGRLKKSITGPPKRAYCVLFLTARLAHWDYAAWSWIRRMLFGFTQSKATNKGSVPETCGLHFFTSTGYCGFPNALWVV